MMRPKKKVCFYAMIGLQMLTDVLSVSVPLLTQEELFKFKVSYSQ
jgi:hypothetical protein